MRHSGRFNTVLKTAVGLIASRSAVVENQAVVSSIKGHNRKVISVEIEIYGVYFAISASPALKPMVFAAKSVCDFAVPQRQTSISATLHIQVPTSRRNLPLIGSCLGFAINNLDFALVSRVSLLPTILSPVIRDLDNAKHQRCTTKCYFAERPSELKSCLAIWRISGESAEHRASKASDHFRDS